MSITKSIQFYAGRKNIKTKSVFGGYYMNYEFCKDIAYKDITFNEASIELINYMRNNDIKIGYCDISVDMGGGYSLVKRYRYYNGKGKIITTRQKYDY